MHALVKLSFFLSFFHTAGWPNLQLPFPFFLYTYLVILFLPAVLCSAVQCSAVQAELSHPRRFERYLQICSVLAYRLPRLRDPAKAS